MGTTSPILTQGLNFSSWYLLEDPLISMYILVKKPSTAILGFASKVSHDYFLLLSSVWYFLPSSYLYFLN